MEIPILIPLGQGSRHGNKELKYLLRSIERNAQGWSKIYLMTVHAPDWILPNDKLEIVPLQDPPVGKDAVLIWKTIMCLKRKHITGDFVWCADDNVFMQPVYLPTLPAIHNHRPNSLFFKEPQTIWRKRVRHTLEWAESKGAKLEHNHECHAPQRFNADLILQNENDQEWMYDETGLTITTYFRVITNTYADSEDQQKWKQTFEIPMSEIREMSDADFASKPFVGYSDATDVDGILMRLDRIFNERSQWEK